MVLRVVLDPWTFDIGLDLDGEAFVFTLNLRRATFDYPLVLDSSTLAPMGRRLGCQPFGLHKAKFSEVPNHSPDLRMDWSQQTFWLLVGVVSEPRNGPEVPPVSVEALQIAL